MGGEIMDKILMIVLSVFAAALICISLYHESEIWSCLFGSMGIGLFIFLATCYLD